MQINLGEWCPERSVYKAYNPLDSGTPPIPKEFKELVKYCAERKLELLTVCNANSHHTVWCSSDINSRGGGFMRVPHGTRTPSPE